MTHSTPWLAPLLLLALAGAAACRSPETSNSAAANANRAAAGGQSNAAAPAGVNPLEGLTRAINAQLSARSFRARMDSVVNGEEVSGDIEYVAPDRFRMLTDGDETIVIGRTAWSRQDGGAWRKEPGDAGQVIASVRDPRIIEVIRQNANVKFVGPDTLDAMPMMVYEYTLRNAMGVNMTSYTKVWVAAADDLPRRIETETNIAGQQTKATITYFDFNTDIKIDPPK